MYVHTHISTYIYTLGRKHSTRTSRLEWLAIGQCYLISPAPNSKHDTLYTPISTCVPKNGRKTFILQTTRPRQNQEKGQKTTTTVVCEGLAQSYQEKPAHLRPSSSGRASAPSSGTSRLCRTASSERRTRRLPCIGPPRPCCCPFCSSAEHSGGVATPSVRPRRRRTYSRLPAHVYNQKD